MSEEELNEAIEYNLEYMEAMQSEEIFGGDYTSSVELKYANKEIDRLEQERDKYKQMYEMEKALFINADLKIERAIEYIQENCYINEEDKTEVCSYGDDLNPSYLLEILKGDKK